ncbi:MAG: hypothetical protein ACHQAU_05295 [Gammaproteobacteria bacterium]
MRPATLSAAILAALSLATPIPALADPVTLVCAGSGGAQVFTLTLDATAGTISLYEATIPATFGDQEISWHDAATGYDSTLNRVSGILTTYAHPFTLQYTCKPGQKQF